jgi:hypothetical protein
VTTVYRSFQELCPKELVLLYSIHLFFSFKLGVRAIQLFILVELKWDNNALHEKNLRS